MSLRPLLEIAARGRALPLAWRGAAARAGGAGRRCRASAMLRPLPAGGAARRTRRARRAGRCWWSAADDVGARDLAAELRAYLAPRRVRYYPSRGTGYASHVAPPPHLVGLRIAALDALAGLGATRSSSRAPWPSPRRCRTPRLRPAGFALERRGGRPRRGRRAAWSAAGYERVEQVEERGQFAIRGGILDVFPATEERAARMELFGDEIEPIRWFSTFTQRSLGEVDGSSCRRPPSSPPSTASWPSWRDGGAEEDGRPPTSAELLPLERFRAAAGPGPREAAVVIAAAEEIEPALRDHWEDVTTAMHDEDARRLYVDVAEPLAERAAISI